MASKLYWDEKIETLPRKELKEYQKEQLAKHLELAYNNSNYYHEAFDKAGVKPSDFKQLSDLAKFPFVHKKIERDRQLLKPLLGDMVAVNRKR